MESRRMGRRGRANPSLTTALCVSMSVHALALAGIALWFATHGPPTWLAGPAEAEYVRLRLPPPPARPPPPKPRPRRPPPPPVPMDAPDPLLKDDSGEHNGHGTANRSTPGDEPMRADRGLEQADLARAKAAVIDPTAARASQAGRRTPDDAVPVSPIAPQRGAYRPDFVAAADAANADPTGRVVPRTATAGIGPTAMSPAVSAPPEDVPPPPVPSGVRGSAVKQSASVAPPPSAREVAGRRATAADTESAPFAKDATVDFHAGRIEGRQGLKVQLFSPRWGLASENDLSVLQELRAVFAAAVRPDGSVGNVSILQSSGSPNVDLDCERAVYDGTFEPRKDKDGHPVATLWTIVYR